MLLAHWQHVRREIIADRTEDDHGDQQHETDAMAQHLAQSRS